MSVRSWRHPRRSSACAVAVIGVLIVSVASPAESQEGPYPRMAPVAEYLMDSSAEVALARSAAPPSLSRDATVLVLGAQGYQTAVQGTNGFVCFVGRSWLAAFDWSEFWSPKIRAADCMNPESARAMVPVLTLRSRMAMAGRSTEEMLAAVKGRFARGVPRLGRGAMDYMMSKESYLTDEGDHNMPHLMFLSTGIAARDWGAEAEASPVMAAPYWFFTPTAASRTAGLPPILVFLVGVTAWSDGTPAGGRGE